MFSLRDVFAKQGPGFLSMRSPKGGRPLARVGSWLPMHQTKHTLSPLHEKEKVGPGVEGDHVVWTIGYCGGCSNKILVRRSTAEYLKDLFNQDYNLNF